MTFSQKVKRKRSDLGLSLRQLSEKTGISHAHISDIEKEKHPPSFEASLKLAKALELDIKDIIIETYQAQLRQSLMDLVKTCHENNIRIPYEEWVKSNLPMQPLGTDESKISDAAFKIATALFNDSNQFSVEEKINLLTAISASSNQGTVYTFLQRLLEPISIACELKGSLKVNEDINRYIKELSS
ncbi:helix-turn-helix transcriptional regulator [uncultured Metabacillus sp.]|uniref:helix-turn-helix domain-containing protein n=1 Tax=uncultured Metabacillus sp. TaxID=2860135 RepID=UPI002639FB04|nr:helix-turn-helix transcriptional regulator [uncultured Metabacillus sp.]